MLKRLAEQQAAIASVLMEGKVRYLMPEGGDWTVIEKLVNILEPFQKVTEAMSTEKCPTISSVKPLLYKLLERVLKVEDSDSSISKQMKEIKSDLAGRYQFSELKTVLNVTTFLDPHSKALLFVSDNEKEKVLEQVEEELLDICSNHSSQDNESKEEAATGGYEPPAKKSRSRKDDKGLMTALLGDLFSKDVMPERLAHSEKVKRELSLYKAEHSAELDCDPLKWWQSRKLAYHLMSKLVQKRFSMVATSVPLERLFSSAGNVINNRQSSLLPENADKHTFLFENSDY